MAIKKRFWYVGDQLDLDGDLGGGNNANSGGGSNSEPLQLKTVGGISLIGSGNIPIPSTEGLESQSNRVNTISANSTNGTYPTSKAVYDFVVDLLGNLEAALNSILEGGE